MEISVSERKPLISASDLLELLKKNNPVIIDAQSGPDSYARYATQHLAGAIHVDLETELSEKKENAANGGRHPLPDVKKFAALLGKIGIDQSSRVVVYDDKSGAFSAARFWWMMKAVGHEQVQVLDGGLHAAIKVGIPTNNKIPIPQSLPPYKVKEWKRPTVTLEDVVMASTNKKFLIIDVREGYRYRGESEPIDLIAGHIPNAVNIPYLDNLDSEGKFLPANELESLYKKVLDNYPADHVIVHCGSGVTGCHTMLALEETGIKGANLYVGSWSEWSRNNLPLAREE